MNIFEWDEQTPVTANNLNEMQNILNDNISEEVLDVYSTTEQRIGTWTNGKPLYRKVITGTKVSGTELAITVDNNLDEIVMTYGGRLIRTDLNRGYAIPVYESSNVYVRVELKQDTKQIAIVSSTGQYSNGNVSIVVCYTKTTD